MDTEAFNQLWQKLNLIETKVEIGAIKMNVWEKLLPWLPKDARSPLPLPPPPKPKKWEAAMPIRYVRCILQDGSEAMAPDPEGPQENWTKEEWKAVADFQAAVLARKSANPASTRTDLAQPRFRPFPPHPISNRLGQQS